MSLGLALSGGGSKAAAFHAGTLRGLSETGLLGPVDVVSSVSGGSIFGAAWMAALSRGESLEAFIQKMQQELTRGFIARTIRPRLLRTLFPGYTRTDALARTFDDIFFHGMILQDLPLHPRLVMNTTVMNHGQTGKFAREGFKVVGLVPRGSTAMSEWIPLANYKVSLAASASAAFPVGLPPVYLGRGEGGVPDGWGATEELRATKVFALTDGGVLEDLGVQTLLNSRSEFGCWDVIMSDAGTRETLWTPGGLTNRLEGLFMGAVSAPVIERVTVLMNDKEDRDMRHIAFGEQQKTWLIEALRDPAVAAKNDMATYLARQKRGPQRRVLMVRLSQGWGHFVSAIPQWRLCGLAQDFEESTGKKAPPLPVSSDEAAKEKLLEDVGRSLQPAKAIFEAMGGNERVDHLNTIATSFSALPGEIVSGLCEHARWQVHAAKAVYW